jgi:hypothetical protein
MVNLNEIFNADGWAFTPGPQRLTEPIQTTDCFEVMEYPLSEIADSLLAFPAIEVVHGAEPSWQDWEAHWQDGESALTFTLERWYDEVWSGTRLRGYCTVGQIFALWTHVLSRHPGIWLYEREHERDLLDTPISFLKRAAELDAEKRNQRHAK